MASTISTPTFSLSFFQPKRLKLFNYLFASSSSANGSTDEESESEYDPIKIALAKAEAYKKAKKTASVSVTAGDGKGNGEVAAEKLDPVKLAMERAREYKNKHGTKPEGTNVRNKKEDLLTNKANKKEEPRISSIDFVGLEFSEKKRHRGMPPGLAPVVEPPLDGEVPEVEIIVGDASKFEVSTPQRSSMVDVDAERIDFYKPKVSTWGVFPRPGDISKTYGGGRTIHPGEVLETAEDKAAKQKRSRELIAAYKRKMGITINAKTKAECEKALQEGDDLMDLGKLQEALPYYEKVMKDVVFQSELYGLAALQWSICQDSLRRSSEARAMYEKLQSHPNARVSKRARQFAFSFQAMEMMKVPSSSFSKTTGYENYFDAFVEDKTDYSPADKEPGERVLVQALPYIIFLMSPIIFVLFLAARKSI